MFAFLEKLKDPQLVWNFQYYFGVRKAAAAAPSSDDAGPTTTNRNRPHNNRGVAQTPPGPKSSNGHAVHPAVPVPNQNGSTDIVTNVPSTCNQNGSHDVITSGTNSRQRHKLTNGENRSSSLAHQKDGTMATTSDSDSGGNSSSGSSSGSTSGSASSSFPRGAVRSVAHVITRPFWYHLFSFGAALGDETFYSSFFPFWFWNIDGAVCRRVVTMWVVIMYIGQSLKDVICWPRPSSPPVVRLEEKWALEYGMPSTHAMVGLAVPFSFLFYTMFRYEYPVILGVLLCSAWCCVVCGSRLYLGMHTVLDIVVGLALSSVLLVVLIPCVDALDTFSLSYAYSPAFVLTAYVAAALVAPGTAHWTPTRGDTVMILGVGAGIALGSWLNFQWGIIRGPPMPPPYRILWPTYEMIGLTLLRTCIGILVVVATRATFKNASHALACRVLGLDRRDRANQRRMGVELSSKFVTYMAVAFNITYLSPAVFRLLNIERATMFTEI